MIVLDASAVLAVIFDEPGGDMVLRGGKGAFISAVNYAEVITKVVEQGFDRGLTKRSMRRLHFQLIPFDHSQADRAGDLRLSTASLGLSLGDRACLALAEAFQATVLTADRQWTDLDLGIDIQLIR